MKKEILWEQEKGDIIKRIRDMAGTTDTFKETDLIMEHIGKHFNWDWRTGLRLLVKNGELKASSKRITDSTTYSKILGEVT